MRKTILNKKDVRHRLAAEIFKKSANEIKSRRQIVEYYLSESNYVKARLWINDSLRSTQNKAWFYQNLSILNILSGELYFGYTNAKNSTTLEADNISYCSNFIKVAYLLGLHSDVTKMFRKKPNIIETGAVRADKIIYSAISCRELKLASQLNDTHNDKNTNQYTINSARILIQKLKFEDAKNKLINALEATPSAKLVSALALNFPEHRLDIQAETLLKKEMWNSPTNPDLFYAYAQHLRNNGEIHKSFSTFKIANSKLKHKMQKTVTASETEFSNLDKSISLKNRPAFDCIDGFKPVFIVGLPRSGTTLIEKILAVNPEIKALGELPYAAIASGQLPKKSTSIRTFRDRYLELLGFSTGSYIDKMPVNFEYLPWIITAFPEAKIIMTDRSLETQIFSVFSRRFNNANYFSSDLSDIYQYKLFYDRIKSYYLSEYSDVVCEFSLDRFHRNNSTEAAKVIKFLGWEYREKYLNFHNSESGSNTMSISQVRGRYLPKSDLTLFWELIKEDLRLH